MDIVIKEEVMDEAPVIIKSEIEEEVASTTAAVKSEIEEEVASTTAAAAAATISQSLPILRQEVEEEIDIMGTSDNEDDSKVMTGNEASLALNRSRREVRFAHPIATSSSMIDVGRPPRVLIPSSLGVKKKIMKKPTRSSAKFVKVGKDMTFNITPDYNYMEDEQFFVKEEIPFPFEDVRLFEDGLDMRPLGEQRYVVDAIANGFNSLLNEARRIQGHLRALNARAGRIRKQIDREEDAIARGQDPATAPRSSKGLDG